MAETAIEWTERSWNPIVGCSLASPGCTNCYAMSMARRLELMGTVSHYAGLTQLTKAGPVWTGKLALAPEHALTEPLRRRKPTTWFVNSMGDLFHEDVPDEWIDRVFAVMALCPQHTFQVLTKRAERMRKYIEGVIASGRWLLWQHPIDGHQIFDPIAAQWHIMLRNVWLGVSAEDQRRADERVPELLATPAVIRFVSAEPLLGPIRFDRIDDDVDTFEDCGGHPDPHWPSDTHDATWLNALTGQMEAEARAPNGTRRGSIDVGLRWKGGKLDWIIVGGENGPRPMQAEWAQQIRDQCAAAGTAFFFKQWGSHIPAGQTMANGKVWAPGCGTRLRAKKGITGRLLDGVEHNAMPRAA
jgi:protein gp37